MYEIFTETTNAPNIYILDNEMSTEMIEAFNKHKIMYQLPLHTVTALIWLGGPYKHLRYASRQALQPVIRCLPSVNGTDSFLKPY